MISTIEFLVLMEPSATCLTCKIKKPNGDREVLDTEGVPAKGAPTVKSVHRTEGKIHEDAKRYQEY